MCDYQFSAYVFCYCHLCHITCGNFFPIWFCLHQSFVEKQNFFENYELLFQSLKQSAGAFVNADSSGEIQNNFVKVHSLIYRSDASSMFDIYSCFLFICALFLFICTVFVFVFLFHILWLFGKVSWKIDLKVHSFWMLAKKQLKPLLHRQRCLAFSVNKILDKLNNWVNLITKSHTHICCFCLQSSYNHRY